MPSQAVVDKALTNCATLKRFASDIQMTLPRSNQRQHVNAHIAFSRFRVAKTNQRAYLRQIRIRDKDHFPNNIIKVVNWNEALRIKTTRV